MGWKFLADWALPVSLAANIGFVVMGGMHYLGDHRGPPDPRHIVAHMAADLPPADAAVLERSFAAHAEAIAAARRAMAGFPERVRGALRASPFDAGALQAVMGQGRQIRDGLDAALTDAFIEAAAKMSPEGRAALAARGGLPGPGGPPPGGPHGPHGPFGGPPDGPPGPPPDGALPDGPAPDGPGFAPLPR